MVLFSMVLAALRDDLNTPAALARLSAIDDPATLSLVTEAVGAAAGAAAGIGVAVFGGMYGSIVDRIIKGDPKKVVATVPGVTAVSR